MPRILPDPIFLSFVAQMTAAMQEQGVSKKELARRLHVPQSTVQAVLNVRYSSIKTETILQFCKAVGLEPELVLHNRIEPNKEDPSWVPASPSLPGSASGPTSTTTSDSSTT